MKLTEKTLVWLLLLAALALPAHASSAGYLDWKPVNPADLAEKTPRVDKDAGAEALFWEVWVMDEVQSGETHTVLGHYVRLKIYTEAGRDKHSTIDLPYFGRNNIRDIAGRTIKPDGSILELKKDAVFERVLIKAGGLKVKAKSFAMPGVEVGSIVEYRWREYRNDALANYIRLPFQREVPVQSVTYHIKPLVSRYFPYDMRTMDFNCKHSDYVREPDGFYRTGMENVPAFVEEPEMPPENQVLSWMLVYYSKNDKLVPEKYWKDYGIRSYDAFKPSTKINGDVRSAADSIVSGATDEEDKLRRIFEYCRTKIKNISNDLASAEERADATRNKTAADTIKQGAGTGFDVDMAFAALATAAGFETRIARLGDRGDLFFDPRIADSYFLNTYNIAVQVKGQWRFFDPAVSYLPYGMLRWQEEGESALLCDSKTPEFVKTPVTPPEKSQRKRLGRFTLGDDGTLEGDVTLEYTGHEGISHRRSIESESPDQRIEAFRKGLIRFINTAEVTAVQLQNADDPEKPLVYKYHVKVPGYAQRTGKRLFLQLAYFQFNEAARFTTTGRKYPVFFHHPWSESDDIEVKMPPGFALDHADAPSPLNFGDAGKYEAHIYVTKDTGKLHYTRNLTFGGNGLTLFAADAYPKVKAVFDRIHEADNHTLTLKQESPETK